jgi:hypothetical protein
MVTLRKAAELALEALEWDADYDTSVTLQKSAITALRQTLEADTKPCACCGEGKARISVTRICDTCGSEYAGREEMDAAKRIEAEQQAEPFGYFKAEPFGWTDCAETDEGAVALYERPNQPAQQPLKPEQIKSLLDDAGYTRSSEYDRYNFINGIRHGERAHGIK